MPLARLKPYDKGAGHLLRRLMVGGQLFVGERGWYRVSEAVAVTLDKIRQPISPGSKGPLTPKAFDITDREGAAEIERIEREAREQRAGHEHPIDLTTADLRGTADRVSRQPVIDVEGEVSVEASDGDETDSSPRASRPRTRGRNKRSR
jgi:hypothetical protein